MLNLRDVECAAKRLREVTWRTPTLACDDLDGRNLSVYLKLENLQHTGSFKLRGAFNLLTSLVSGTQAKRLITASSGNHGYAVGLLAHRFQAQVVVVLPHDCPRDKEARVRSTGAAIVRYDRYSEDRSTIVQSLARERGLEIVPSADPRAIAGNGTVALELLDDVPDLDIMLVPIGGGGLIAGCATVATALRPSMRVIGVEPETGDDTRQSLLAGRRLTLPVGRSIADGMLHGTPDEEPFEIIRRLVDDVVTVSEDEIVRGMSYLFHRLGLVVEPSGATAICAFLADKIPRHRGRVGVVVSGGNIESDRFAQLVDLPRLAKQPGSIE